MEWFKNSVDHQTKALVAESVAAYAERAKLSYQLLTIRPQVNASEMAALWAFWASLMESAQTSEPKNDPSEWEKMLHSITSTFFLSFCQSFLENVCHSTLKLELTSPQIMSNMETIFNAMTAERAKELGSLASALSTNALRLAGATIGRLRAGLTKQQVQAASRYALSLVEKDQNLNPFERQQATDWLTNAFRD